MIVSCTFSVFKQCVGQAHKVHETITFSFLTLPNIHRLVFTRRLSYKPFLIWLLTIPPHLKYADTLPHNLSLMACFADINVSQGSIATYARCGGIFIMHLTANLPRNLPVKKNCKSVKIWQNAHLPQSIITCVADNYYACKNPPFSTLAFPEPTAFWSFKRTHCRLHPHQKLAAKPTCVCRKMNDECVAKPC